MKYLLVLLSLIIVGCGYKPSTHFTDAVLKEKIFTQISINVRDPENTVFVKDALNEAVLQKFGASLVAKEQADSRLLIALSSVSFSPLQYDDKGFIIAYNTYVSLSVTREAVDKESDESVTKSYSVRGTYDFPITANSVISDNKRFTAIKEASLKALNHFVSRVSFEGYKDDTQ
jgi:hypothetical protein